jgi:hypothetical protein
MEATMVNLERSRAMAASAASKMEPAKKLEDVVTPGSIASFLPPSAWQPLRDAGLKLDEAEAEVATIEKKIREVDEAIFDAGARRVRDVAALAKKFLADGQVMAAPPEPTPQGLAAAGGEALRALKDGLLQSLREAKDNAAWWRSRAQVAKREVEMCAAEFIATEYGAFLAKAADLHCLLDALESITVAGLSTRVSGGRRSGWRRSLAR